MKFPSILVGAVVVLLTQIALPAEPQVKSQAAQYDFPIYTNKPAGKQVSGQHAPAATPPLSPEDAQKKFTVPEGFEVRLFAAEPMVVNPVAMSWDERGRLWVVELYEYPLGATAGAKPRDRIKILEDTDGDGRADKVKVFADGLNLATGILLGYGGVFVGQAPDFLFLEDTNGDDVADRRTVLKTGFGLHDRHELLNSFTWGPDGWLYLTHGVFTHSKVKDPNDPNDPGVTMDAAVARYHPRTKKFEVFADGTSNPWGVDFDRAGNAFVSACVIDHLFHMAPGCHYTRQGGTPANPYGYELLPSIVDHRHKMAAYAGAQVYEGSQYPEEYRGTIFIGNIHDNSVHQDRLTPNGSSFKASFIKDFVRANDGWFMPVSSQIGPDGAVWIMDWYDKYPCYQNANADPDGVDREHGRIWRVVYTGKNPGAKVPSRPEVKMNLAQATSAGLVGLLSHPNIWQRRMAQRILTERSDPLTKDPLQKLLTDGKTVEARLAALWTLHSSGQLDETRLEGLAADKEPAIRAWVARLTGERREASEQILARLRTLAGDRDPSVRLAVATALRQFISGALTVNTPVPDALTDIRTGPVMAALIEASADAKDPLIPFMIWMAAEPTIARDPANAFTWMRTHGAATMPLSGTLMRKIMRRICDTQRPDRLDAAVDFLASLPPEATALTVAGLDGLIEGQKGKALLPAKPVMEFLAKLSDSRNAALVDRAQRLGTLWGDAAALKSVLAKVNDARASDEERIKAVQVARQTKTDPARDAMLEVINRENPEPVVVEAIRALSEIGGDDVPAALVKQWKRLPARARSAAAEMMASRGQWTRALLSALEGGTISPSDIPITVVRALSRSKDDSLRERAVKAIGRFHEPDQDKLKLIAEKRKVVVNGPVDLDAGREVARKACLICHKFHGEGTDVGPDLTGVGRSSLDALLANILDPNRIIGRGYENVEVDTKDGRSVNGRLIEDTDTRVRIISAGPKEEVIARSNIGSMRITEISVMPEGLEQMPDADFRNLIWYILNPPQDNRPMTPQLRKELIGDDPSSAHLSPARDNESVALWNPEWRVLAPDFEGSPAKLYEYAGRKNVLMTHPYDANKGAALERLVTVPAGKTTLLMFGVAAHERGDWELRVLADGKLLHKQIVDRNGERWKQVKVDLSRFAGQKVTVRLENCANDWEWEFGYWSDIQLKSNEPQQARR